MQIVYYYVVYIKMKDEHDPSKTRIDIRLQPFDTQKQAEAFKKLADERFKDQIQHSCIKKVDLTKHEGGIWLK